MRSLLPLLALAACSPWITDTEYEDRIDADNDGYATAELDGGDCDDGNPDIHPDAIERCDLVDDNCDGQLLPCVGTDLDASRVVWGESEGAGLGADLQIGVASDGTYMISSNAPDEAQGGSIYVLDVTRGESSAADSSVIIRGTAGGGAGGAYAMISDPLAFLVGRPDADQAQIIPAPEGEITDQPADAPPPFTPDNSLSAYVLNTMDFGAVIPAFESEAPGLVILAPSARSSGAARGALYGYTGDPPDPTNASFSIAGTPRETLSGPALRYTLGVPSPDNGDIVVGLSATDSVAVFKDPVPGMEVTEATFWVRGNSGSGLGATLDAIDYDGNGEFDLVVGAPNEESDVARAGAVYVFFKATLADATKDLSSGNADISVTGHEIGLGVSRIALGDVNGDTETDLVVAAPSANSGAGALFLFLGPLEDTRLSTADADIRWDNSDPNGALGTRLETWELQGQGYDSVLATAPGQDSPDHPDAGAVFAFDLPENQ